MTTGPLVERRAGQERRMNPDRRSGLDRRSGIDRRGVADRRSNLVYLVADGGQRRASPLPVQAAQVAAPARPPLQEREFTILEMASQAYDAAINPHLWPQALAGLRTILQADACAIAEHETASGRGRLLHWIGASGEFAEIYADQYRSVAVRPADSDGLAEPGTVTTSENDEVGAGTGDSSALRGWLEAHDLAELLRGVVDKADGVATHVLFLRSGAKGAFGADDAALVGRLIPGLARALRAGRALRRAQFFHQIAFDALDAVPIGVAFVDAAGEITAANRIARQIIEGENVRAYQETTRRAEASGRTSRLRRAVFDAMGELQESGGDAVSAFSVTRRPGLRPLTCLLAPLGASADYGEADRPSAMLFIGDPDKPMSIDQRRLRQLYGLSRAEARVVALLAQGYKLDATADSLGLVYETVRKHLKQVFDKTGCDRQAELVRLLVTGPAALPI